MLSDNTTVSGVNAWVDLSTALRRHPRYAPCAGFAPSCPTGSGDRGRTPGRPRAVPSILVEEG